MKRLFIAIASLVWLVLPATAFAYNPLGSACGSQGETGGNGQSATVCSSQNTGNPIYGSGGVLEKVTLILATVAGIAAVIIIIVAGFSYVTSGGNSQHTEGARNAIIGALVGLVIIAAASSILTFVISKL